MSKKSKFDVIVIGGGHAGIEAAYAAAKMGSKTALITLTLDTIGLMPCNPAIGGVGKGHIVYEISAMGGLMPKLCTQTYIQARMLNTRKGPAVQGLRLQIDKDRYSALARQMLEQTKNLTLIQAAADTIIQDDSGAVSGLKTECGQTFYSPTIIITTGTFLNGKIFIGDEVINAGRRNERAVSGLSTFLYGLHLKMGRLKTGTPPRLATDSIDTSVMEYQEPDQLSYLYEFAPHQTNSTHPCYITHTNENTFNIIKNNLDKSALFNGNIVGMGPRYCPSIEDKIGRFPNKMSHHVFVEPEGADGKEVYPNGISTSLPRDIQEQYVRSIKGFENAVITKPGYAVEYDFVLPNQLHESMELKKVPGLFLAGQINGTTGYEEAAAQGMIAGINAHLKQSNLPPFILDRTESYIGVMINDLTTMGVDEPYRMFTSRAERRLILRQDNAFLRLTDKAHNLGLIDEQMYAAFLKEKAAIIDTLETVKKKYKEAELMRLFGQKLPSNTINLKLSSPFVLSLSKGTNTKKHSLVCFDKLSTNGNKTESGNFAKLLEKETGNELSDRAALTVHAEIRYAPYIAREAKEAERQRKYQKMKIPADFIYTDLPGLSKELQEKLNRYRPETIASASLIPGMTPAALSLLIFKCG